MQGRAMSGPRWGGDLGVAVEKGAFHQGPRCRDGDGRRSWRVVWKGAFHQGSACRDRDEEEIRT
jgi:hypothetical protein